MKKIVLILILIALAAVVVFYFHLPSSVEPRIRKGLEALTGNAVEINGFSANGPDIRIQAIHFKNPAGFSAEDLALVENVQINMEILPLIRGQWSIHHLSCDVKEIRVEKNGQGELNLSTLAAVKGEALEHPARKTNFLIGHAELALGTLSYLDSANAEAEPEWTDFQGQKEIYDHVTDPSVLIQAPVLQVVNRLGKGSLGLPRGKIQESIARHMGGQEAV